MRTRGRSLWDSIGKVLSPSSSYPVWIGILVLLVVIAFNSGVGNSAREKVLQKASLFHGPAPGVSSDNSVVQEVRVLLDGSTFLTETVNRTVQEQDPRHGFRRDFASKLTLGEALSQDVKVSEIKVWRDGGLEPFELKGGSDPRVGPVHSIVVGSADVVLDPGTYEYVIQSKVEGITFIDGEREGIAWIPRVHGSRGAQSYTFLLKLPPFVLPGDLQVSATAVTTDEEHKATISRPLEPKDIPLSYPESDLPGEKNISTLMLNLPHGISSEVGFNLMVTWPKGFIKWREPEVKLESPTPSEELPPIVPPAIPELVAE